VRKYFSKFEPIHSIVLISDRETGRSRGFGFIELEEDRVDNAIQELGDTIFGGRNLRISRAKDRSDSFHPQPSQMRMPQMANA
jgi:RNA recognition motif-containing protein